MQVEYYFSDKNLQTDKFLMNYVTKDKEGFGKCLTFFSLDQIGLSLWKILSSILSNCGPQSSRDFKLFMHR